MNRTQKFLYNSGSTAIMQIVVLITGFITPRIMLSVYGSEINGLVSSITQFIAYFNLVEAGLASAATYALYKPLSDKDNKAINGVVSATKKFYTQAGYMFVSLTLGLAFIYPNFINSSTMSYYEIVILVLVLGSNGALEFFTLSKYRVLLSADQKTYVISIATTIHIIINTVIIVILSYFNISIIVLRLIALISIFIRSAILMLYCKRKYRYIKYNAKPNFKALDKRWDALYLQLLGAIQIGAPIIIITVVLNDLRIVSVYSIFNMVVAGVNGVLSIFVNGLAASFGEIIVKKELKVLQIAYKQFEFAYYCLISIIYGVTFITI
ncbi:MAG: hypothetical protein ACRC7N_22175, partial [Clostridium sp.]